MIEIAARPDGGVCEGQPVLPGSCGSRNFRIPCLLTLPGRNGALAAAADVRWDAEADGGGLDILFSRSEDGGKTWTYSLPAYLGDNGNRHCGASSTMMDPQLAADSRGKLFLTFDLFPHGRAMLAGEGGADEKLVPGECFSRSGDLLLRARGEKEYRYCLFDGSIFDCRGARIRRYSVDGWFHYTCADGTRSNLFFEGGDFEVVPTSYLAQITSSDGGITWSAPRLIRAKKPEEAFCGTAPGRGLTLSDGTVLLPIYNGSEAGFLASRDHGANWKRFGGIEGTESQLVELSDGTVRMFFRNFSDQIRYADFRREGDRFLPGEAVSTGIPCCSNCMISAIRLSYPVDGKEAVAVSCPTELGTWSGRFHGKILILSVEEDRSMTVCREIEVTGKDEFFAYSCLTELPDGRLALLYEDSCLHYLGSPRGIGCSRAVYREFGRIE